MLFIFVYWSLFMVVYRVWGDLCWKDFNSLRFRWPADRQTNRGNQPINTAGRGAFNTHTQMSLFWHEWASAKFNHKISDYWQINNLFCNNLKSCIPLSFTYNQLRLCSRPFMIDSCQRLPPCISTGICFSLSRVNNSSSSEHTVLFTDNLHDNWHVLAC